jgi:hypothetical protein
MKNKIVGLVAAICCTLTVSSAKAQCPGVMVKNSLSCNMTVKVQFYTNCPNPTVCGVQNTLFVAAGNSVPINCNLCGGTSCDVLVSILYINGVVISPVPQARYVVTAPGSSIAMPPSCNPTGATLYFDPVNNEFVAQ